MIIEKHSFVAQLAALEVGESASRMQLIDPGLSIRDAQASLPEMKDAMRNSAAPAARRAKAAAGGEFTIEVFDTVTPERRNWFVIAVVTRVS